MNRAKQVGRALARTAGLGAGSVELHRETLELPHWPARLAGTRVAVLADLHTGSPQIDEDRLEELVALVRRQSPDVVVTLGDYIDPSVALGEWVSPEAIASRLGRLDAPLGVWAVLGNHDWGEAGPRMPAALRDAGITVLENDARAVPGGGFWIAGLGDLMTRTADLEGTLAAVPDGEPVLLLSHNPDVFPRVPERVALTLTGHTHGAQVDIPVLRDRMTPSRYGARYTGGHIVEGGRHLYASDGIGTSRWPIRFRAKPEIALLTLE